MSISHFGPYPRSPKTSSSTNTCSRTAAVRCISQETGTRGLLKSRWLQQRGASVDATMAVRPTSSRGAVRKKGVDGTRTSQTNDGPTVNHPWRADAQTCAAFNRFEILFWYLFPCEPSGKTKALHRSERLMQVSVSSRVPISTEFPPPPPG